ncbi:MULTISPECIES: PRC-barrel domain-containing protein [unclassified Roseivivax]|uniref:PRC-barrel domain-containing protein n=1 Tax=Roseivivax sp. GX 12232 TaxID=2900547 RepID=UPI001E402002|nr:PRC-barrel domain-containing protein [Roseivivax sp. GX 12232]MCE0506489.1 PRC-barrel domain-containing protein [Roseivivax sp. GX 12232]
MTSALALTLATGTAFADSHTAGQDMENAAEQTGDAIKKSAEATENAAENAAQTAENAGEEMANEVKEAAGIAEDAELIRTRDITDGPVYSVNAEDGIENIGAETYDSVSDDWDQIGSIEDVVLTREGEFRGVVIEIGGFLDLGDKHVFMSTDDVQLVPVDDVNYALAVGQSEEQLEEMEGVDETFWQ